jgi:hypothetical protein
LTVRPLLTFVTVLTVLVRSSSFWATARVTGRESLISFDIALVHFKKESPFGLELSQMIDNANITLKKSVCTEESPEKGQVGVSQPLAALAASRHRHSTLLTEALT